MAPETPAPFRTGLSGRLLLLTGLFMLMLSALIYVPAMTNFRDSWLSERLSQARAAALILEKTPPDALPKPLVDELLAGMESTMIALRIDNMRRLLAVSDMPPMIDLEVDLRDRAFLPQMMRSLDTLVFGGNRTMRIVGPPPRGGDFVEIVIPERPLREAMLHFSWTVLVIALAVSGLTALIVFLALNGLIVRPVQRLAAAVVRFRTDPIDSRTILRPDHRSDEIGTLERAVAAMQDSVQQELRQRERLASLGLAVAKINHDLRNMLASAQLMADRLSVVPDPNVQRFVPKLVSALDRAIAFCQSTLAYGKAEEQSAHITRLFLQPEIEEAAEFLGLSTESAPALTLDIAPDLAVEADADHLQRALNNLLRNAKAALEATPMAEAGLIRIHATRRGNLVDIDIRDNGPGIPERVRERLFQAFSGSARPGGAGLGLAIALELVRGMGGTLSLLPPQAEKGTAFRLTLPAA